MQNHLNAIALAGFIALAGCAQAEEEVARIEVPEGASAGDYSSEACTYTAREVDYAAECGVLVVPENRNDAASRLIAIPVIRVLSFAHEPAEPIFWLTGGPGVANDYLSRVSNYIATHDVVLTGYRGVDGSVRLDCPEAARALGNGLLTREGFDALEGGFRQCHARLAASGIDTDGYTVLEVVDDVEAARVALGYDRINLASASYGTRLAMIYTWRYPGRVFRNAMVAVNPPGGFWWDPAILDAQIRRYGELCAVDEYCSSRTDDLAALMARVAHDMPERWLIFPVDESAVLFGTFMALYQTSAAASVFDMWIAADEGDASGFALMTLAFPFMIPSDFAWGDSISKALSTDYDYVPGHDYVADVLPGEYILGSPGSALGWAGAAGWPVNKIPNEYREVQASAVRTLLLSGTLDVSTPYENARDQLLPFLSNGEQVVLSEAAHTGDLYYLQPEATRHLLTTFYDTGRVDASRFVPNRVSFEAQWGFPLIAKLALTGAIAALIILLLVLRFVVRLVGWRG